VGVDFRSCSCCSEKVILLLLTRGHRGSLLSAARAFAVPACAKGQSLDEIDREKKECGRRNTMCDGKISTDARLSVGCHQGAERTRDPAAGALRRGSRRLRSCQRTPRVSRQASTFATLDRARLPSGAKRSELRAVSEGLTAKMPNGETERR
jgi:hypothetical protein